MHRSSRRGGRKFFRRGNFPKNHNSKADLTTHTEKLSEQDVGITEYISSFPGFSGVLKARFSDFQVNEISLDDEVAKITNTRVPADFVTNSNDTKDGDDVPQATPSKALPQEVWEQILDMMGTDENKTVECEAASLSKDERGEVHAAVKKVFKQKIVASTITKEEKKYLEFKKYNKDERQDTRVKWPDRLGEYVHFLVYKENTDTLEATLKISDCLNMKASSFTYAGVKDRRAKTTQWFCVRKVNPWKLLRRTRHLRMLHVGNITFKDRPLKLGELSGNKFRIALRNVVGDDESINSAIDCLKERGFINYYGLQRFGNDKEVPTYEVGLQLLLGNFKQACDLILKCKKSDVPLLDTTIAKKMYNDTGDAKEASDCFNENANKCVESKLMIGLAKSNVNDYVNALENVPRNMRLLYTHAFQGLVWNKIVSKRIKEFGLKPIAGDLVVIKEDKSDEVEKDVSVMEDERNEENDNNEKDEIRKKQQVKILAAEDLDNYSIYDVVLPLPGYDILYPTNIVKEWYKEVLEGYGLSLEMPQQNVKTYTLSGSYRKIVEKVKDLSSKFMRYNNPYDNLIRSDFEELLGKEEPEDTPDGKYKALLIEFCVTPSSYATMAIREILKTDTSSSAQSKLNNYHEAVATSSTNRGKAPEAEIDCAQTKSLLSDREKFEEFKRSIFGAPSDDALKRKCDEEKAEETPASKKSKNDDDEETKETGLKLEPSLV